MHDPRKASRVVLKRREIQGLHARTELVDELCVGFHDPIRSCLLEGVGWGERGECDGPHPGGFCGFDAAY